MEQIEKWAEKLNKDVYNEWKSKYHFWDPGFKVFFSPIHKKPKLMILSLNPGGSKFHYERESSKQFENNDFSLPKRNEYLITDYKMAKKMRLFFEDYHKLLEQSVALPIVFFRSKDWNYWKEQIPKNKRKEMEQFSYHKVKEIIKMIKPEMYLIIGFSTYSKIKRNILDVKNEHSIKSGTHRLYLTAFTRRIPIFCIPHLTGYRLSNTKLAKIRKEFFQKLK